MNIQYLAKQIKKLSTEEQEALSVELNKKQSESNEWIWKPQEGETYWYISLGGLVGCKAWTGHQYDIDLYNAGNCYKTEAEAIRVVKGRQLEVKIKEYCQEQEFRKDNLTIAIYCGQDGEAEAYNASHNSFILPGFENMKDAEAVIDEFGDDIKKYIFNLEGE